MKEFMCKEIVCIENIVDLQATYSVLNLSLSNLIFDIIKESARGFISILNVRVFLYSLQFIPFTDEQKAQQLRVELVECLNNRLYAKSKKWTVQKFIRKIRKLQDLIMWDYIIDGSLVMYNNDEIRWDLDVSFMLIEGHAKLYNVIEN